MENAQNNSTTTEEQGSNVDAATAAKIKEFQEKQMAAFYKSKTPNLRVQRVYYEELAAIWKARLDELKNRIEFIQLSAQIENEFSKTNEENGQENSEVEEGKSSEE
jgi:hypothetical protein